MGAVPDEIIREIEGQALGWFPTESGRVYRGSPFLIEYPIEFEPHIIKSTVFRIEPFSYFTIPSRESPTRVDLVVHDLAFDRPFDVEITRKWMRVYLPHGTPGTVLAHLFEICQEELHPGVVLRMGTGYIVLPMALRGAGR